MPVALFLTSKLQQLKVDADAAHLLAACPVAVCILLFTAVWYMQHLAGASTMPLMMPTRSCWELAQIPASKL